MRYSKQHKARTRARIVQNAAAQLRDKGAHGIGVADLMKQAGLTHGGFYAHFKSREALLIEALAYAMDHSHERWSEVFEQAPQNKGIAALIEFYVTESHRDNRSGGCTVATLGSEVTREGAKTRKMFVGKLERMVDTLSDRMDGSRKQNREQAIATLATMIGTILMARIAGTGEFSSQILDAGRKAALAHGGAAGRSRRTTKAVSASKKAKSVPRPLVH